jgi:hypothetical protein
MSKEKTFTKAYRLVYVAKKNTLTHEMLARCIYPAEEARPKDWNMKLKGIACHSYGQYASLHDSHHYNNGWGVPISQHKPKHGYTCITIIVSDGSYCEECKTYNSNVSLNNSDDTFSEQFSKIDTREKMATFLRLAKNKSVKINTERCGYCIRMEKQKKEETEMEECLKTLKIKNIKELPRREPASNAQSKKSDLYIMKCNRTGYYKIGKSNNPKHREKTLQAETPNIQMIATFIEYGWQESEWHNYFVKHRLRGEWFDLTKTQVAYMVSKMRNNKQQMIEA